MSSPVETSGFCLNLLFVRSQISPLGFASVGMTKRFAEHEGLIGLRITKLPTNMSRMIAKSAKSDFVGNDPVWTSSDISCYWIDLSRDYLVIEHTEIRSGRKTTNITLETKQTPSGQWYPSHIRHEYTYTLPGGKQTVNRIDKRIVLETEPVFPDGIFQADYVFNP